MLWCLSLLITLTLSFSQPPRTLLSLQWVPDTNYISTGIPKNITQNNLIPTFSTVRSFPNDPNRRKFCYVVPMYRTAKYLIRMTYYYGEGSVPPVFDQIVDRTLWSVVNTTEDYARGRASYYEGVFGAAGKSMSVCLALSTSKLNSFVLLVS